MRKEILERILASGNEIELIEANITDDEIEEISHLIIEKKAHVKNIYLSGNQISDQGAIMLAKNLKKLEDLSFLELQDNQIGAKGIAAIFRLKLTLPYLELAIGGNKLTNISAIEKIKDEILSSKP